MLGPCHKLSNYDSFTDRIEAEVLPEPKPIKTNG